MLAAVHFGAIKGYSMPCPCRSPCSSPAPYPWQTLVSRWPPASEISMLLLTTFVELRLVAGRSQKRAGRPQAVPRRPMLIHKCHAVLCRGLEKSLSERHGRSAAGARHGHGMASVNRTRPRCVNQMGKTQSKPLAARHGRGTAWARHAVCELAFKGSVNQQPFRHE